MVGLVIVAGVSAHASAAPKGQTTRAFAETFVGSQISGNSSSDEEVFKVVGSLDGTGAAIVDNSTPGTSFPVRGTNSGTIYYADGVSRRTEKFVLSAPNAKGVIAYTGSGRCVGGTGVHKKERCTYTITGSFNTKTGIDRAKETGTDTR